MKKLLVVFASLSILLAGWRPLSSATGPESTFMLSTNALFSQSSLDSKRILTWPSQNGDLSTLVGSGEMTSRSGVVEPQKVVVRDSRVVPISMHKRIRERQKAAKVQKGKAIIPIAVGPPARASTMAPETPPPLTPVQSVEARVTTLQAPSDMQTFRQHDMTNAEAPIIDRSTVLEPSTISVENAVFYTSNWFAARSIDGGQTFTYIDPYTAFPPISGGFCCDQVSAYAPKQNMALWGLMYGPNGQSIRIARTIGSAGIASNEWTYYDFYTQNFGFPAGADMDFPIITVGDTFLYAASQVFSNIGVYLGSVVWRIPLAELAAGGPINFNYLARTDISTIRLAEGAGATMYWASFRNTTTLRIHRWDDGSPSINWDDIAVNAFTYLSGDGISFTADGRNWATRADSRPLGVYVSNGIIGVFWMAKQGASFPQPYTIHARFNETTRALITQTQIWNSTFAWLYPNVTVNVAGNIAGVLAYGGGTGAQVPAYPHSLLWVLDDVEATLPLGGTYPGIIGNAGPTDNIWGDYLTVRRHSQFPNTWVASVYALNGTTVIPRYIWFGRQRDRTTRVSDFDGDARSDIAVFRPGTGTWYISQSTAGFLAISFGVTGDLAAPADYDGDGRTDVAVFRPSTGTWYLLRSGLGFTALAFGTNGDVPAVGDFDGDGKADVGVFRPSNGTWYIQTSQLGFFAMAFGTNGDNPAVGDYDYDGKADIAVFRPSTGVWYIQQSALGFLGVAFGTAGDKPTPADYDSDGMTDIAVFRPGNGTWYAQRSSLGFDAFAFGASGDKPAPGDFDGDGKADFAVFRPSTGTWYIQRSQLGFLGLLFGTDGDIPTSGSYIP